MEQEYIITVFSENKVGLLSQITTVFTCRNVNIESLTTSESALTGIHKFTIVVRTGPDRVEKLARQVEKKIDVLKALGFHDFDFYQTLLKNPMYTNEDVEDVVPGYQSGGYVAIIAHK